MIDNSGKVSSWEGLMYWGSTNWVSCLASISLSIVVTFLCATTTSAATFHVSPTGLNVPPYDADFKAANYIGDAVLAASGYGDVILIHPGSYDIDTTIFLPPGLTLAGVSRDQVVLNWTDEEHRPGRMFEGEGDHEIYGIEFNYPKGSNFNSAVLALYLYNFTSQPEKHLLFRDCRVRHAAIYMGGLIQGEFTGCEIYFGTTRGIMTSGGRSAVTIHHNSFYGTTIGRGVDFYLFYGYEPAIVEHNTFDTDASGGVPTGVWAGDAINVTVRNNLIMHSAEPVWWSYSTGHIENNTMIGAVGSPGGFPPHNGIFTLLESYNTLTMRNNIMADFQALWEFGRICVTCGPPGVVTFVHNAFWPPADSFYANLSRPITVVDSANFNLYPMFSGDSNYTLLYGSALIDAGDPALLDPDGSRSDIGMWGGPAGSTYTYTDLPPLKPDPVTLQYSSPDVTLWWPENHEGDFLEYEVWRDIVSGVLPPHSFYMATLPDGETTFVDSNVPVGSPLYYRVFAFDETRNSAMSDEIAVVPTGILDQDEPNAPLPLTPYIAAVRPNPFNASTVFDVIIPEVGSSPAPVEILIYDTLGRLVATAFRGSLPYGRQSIAWDARGSDGKLPSGVYFARLKVWNTDFGHSIKLALVK